MAGRRRRHGRRAATRRAGAAAWAMALACGAAAAWLAWQHPSQPLAMAAAAAGLALVCARWPLAALALPLAGLGLLSFAPWTGWTLVEEFDIALLAALGGGWVGIGLADRRRQPSEEADGTARVWWLLALLVAALTAWSVQRGLADAGAWPLPWSEQLWWQGWREPANSLRAAKGFALALLSWPLWQAQQARWPQAASRALAGGLLASLAAVSLVATWERWAWPGLTNFSTDYRTTALFWEMHIGGAALDAFLALTLPFALHGLRQARGRAAWLLAAAIATVAGYAVLTTFSRGLYLALPVALLLWAWAVGRAAPELDAGAGVGAVAASAAHRRRDAVASVGWWLIFMAGGWWVFEAGGYRGLLAWWGLFALWVLGRSMVPLPAQAFTARRLGLQVGMAALLGLLASGLALALPQAMKAPYLLYALIAAGGALAVARPGRLPWSWWAAWAALVPAAVAVAWHWGDDPATRWLAAPPALLLAMFAAWQATRDAARLRASLARRPTGSRAMALSLAAMALGALLIGTLAGGAYLGDRMARTGQDWQDRLAHWARSASLVRPGAESVLGIGSGRFAARFALSGESTDQTGDYRWQPDPRGGGRLVLTAGQHVLGFGELFRMSQRLAPVGDGPLTLRWSARGDPSTRLHVEICQKHLLYDDGCRTAQVALGAATGADGAAIGEVQLSGPALPRAPVFSVAVDSRGARVEIDRLSLVDAAGRELLVNGGFDRGLWRWLPSSDRHHLPWHAKNLALQVFVEQGWAGLAGLTTLFLFAVARLTLGRARHHRLAAPLLAGLAAMLVVGLFDSVLDNPRIAWLWFLLLGVAATLRWRPGQGARPA